MSLCGVVIQGKCRPWLLLTGSTANYKSVCFECNRRFVKVFLSSVLLYIEIHLHPKHVVYEGLMTEEIKIFYSVLMFHFLICMSLDFVKTHGKDVLVEVELQLKSGGDEGLWQHLDTTDKLIFLVHLMEAQIYVPRFSWNNSFRAISQQFQSAC